MKKLMFFILSIDDIIILLALKKPQFTLGLLSDLHHLTFSFLCITTAWQNILGINDGWSNISLQFKKKPDNVSLYVAERIVKTSPLFNS